MLISKTPAHCWRPYHFDRLLLVHNETTDVNARDLAKSASTKLTTP